MLKLLFIKLQLEHYTKVFKVLSFNIYLRVSISARPKNHKPKNPLGSAF